VVAAGVAIGVPCLLLGAWARQLCPFAVRLGKRAAGSVVCVLGGGRIRWLCPAGGEVGRKVQPMTVLRDHFNPSTACASANKMLNAFVPTDM